MSLTAKVMSGLEYYRVKYGKKPDMVYINPRTLEGNTVVIPNVTIKASRQVLPNHFWIGVSNVPKGN